MRKMCSVLVADGESCDAPAVDSIPFVHHEGCDGEFQCSVYGCGELPLCAEHWDKYVSQCTDWGITPHG